MKWAARGVAIRPAHFSVFTSLAGAAVLGAVVLLQVADVGREAEAALEAIAPRYARLAGMRESAAAVARAAAQAEAALAHFAYPPAMGSDRIGTDLQQRLRAAAEAAGVGVVNSQIVAGKTGAGLEEVPVSMTLEAEPGQLQQMLQALQAPAEQAPAIFVDGVTIQRPRGRAGETARLTVQGRFSALRRVP